MRRPLTEITIDQHHARIQHKERTFTNKCPCCFKSVLQGCWSMHAHTQEHSPGMTSDFGLCNKQGTKCTVDCFTVKRRWIRHLLSLPSWYGFKVDYMKVCGWVFVCVPVPVTVCWCMWLLCWACTLYITCIFMYNNAFAFTQALVDLIKPIWFPSAWYKRNRLRASCVCMHMGF